MTRLSRRQFAASGLATLAFAGLARRGLAAPAEDSYRNQVAGYGPLVPDPRGLFDLPAGFGYRVISAAGEAMDDGFVTPDHFDGMGCFALGGSRVALVRNHELQPGHRALGPAGGRAPLEARLRALGHYGAYHGGGPLPGGTTTLVCDLRSGRRLAHYLSLAGTAVNCAGGVTPWGSWLTCEETELKPGEGVRRDHGWVFEVPARRRGLAEPVPIKAMGRFRHEAAAVDPRTGIVYLTEDQRDSLFYRFLPDVRTRLAAGGRLQALGLRDAPRGGDTRNWSARAWRPGDWREAVWIDLDGVDSPSGDLRRRGHAAGAALFARGEGIHHGAGEFY
ncbi:MAG TPA: alkaline phosphatase PhoX, partial [Allosphingosinicella sp.]|nr:alkaline phosphatase PhoX [Allosphingosinicella sp.]